jgi:hypothetical protein
MPGVKKSNLLDLRSGGSFARQSKPSKIKMDSRLRDNDELGSKALSSGLRRNNEFEQELDSSLRWNDEPKTKTKRERSSCAG